MKLSLKTLKPSEKLKFDRHWIQKNLKQRNNNRKTRKTESLWRAEARSKTPRRRRAVGLCRSGTFRDMLKTVRELFSGLKKHLQYKTSQFYSQTKASSGRHQKSACNSRTRASRNLGQDTNHSLGNKLSIDTKISKIAYVITEKNGLKNVHSEAFFGRKLTFSPVGWFLPDQKYLPKCY